MDIRTMNPGNARKKAYIPAQTILAYLIGNHEKVDTMIICKDPNVELYTTDLALHEAFGSVMNNDEIRTNKIAKFFENVDVYSYRQGTKSQKPILTFERVDALRKLALAIKEKVNHT